MYRPSAFAIDDIPAIHNVIRERVFATIASIVDGGIQFAYAPVIVDAANGARGGVRFHLASRNPLAGLADGARVWLSMNAADAYVSPDWYRTLVTVPTWNYISVEGEGAVRRQSRAELRHLVVDLSAQEEAKLAPKPPWLIDKVPAARAEALLNAITGFSLSFERLEGKFKLSQDKPAEDFAGAIAGLEARGDAASLAIARAMRHLPDWPDLGGKMTADDRGAYLLGDSRSELERLERQARFYAPATEALFAAAGIGPGMRILDIGSGAGDVSMLAACIVGPGGTVLGIERSPQAVETARARSAAAGLAQCRFETMEADAFKTDDRFDAIVGRLILLYLPDPAATIRNLTRFLKPGGVVAFQDLYLDGSRGYPDSALLNQCMNFVKAAFARVGGDLAMGLKLFETICRAGLPDPAVMAAMPIITRADPEGYKVIAGLMRTLLPALEQFGIATATEIDIDTLEERLLDEVSQGGQIYLWPPLIGAWSRVP